VSRQMHAIFFVPDGSEARISYYRMGKAIPLQAWTGSEGSRKLRPLDFKTIGTWR